MDGWSIDDYLDHVGGMWFGMRIKCGFNVIRMWIECVFVCVFVDACVDEMWWNVNVMWMECG